MRSKFAQKKWRRWLISALLPVKGVKQISFSGGSIDDKDLDENDVLHSNNREWLLGKLAEADEDIQAGRVVPSSKALFEDVISRGKARLKEGGQ